ncbi:MAG: hypothetical protein R6V27_13020 [Balneolaceae bacterium]
MTYDGTCLGICYSDSQLYYSAGSPGNPAEAQHIGSFDFNFNVKEAIVNGRTEAFAGIERSISDLKEKFNCTSVRILAPADEECWTVLPRAVYENSDEREAHIRILAHSSPREDLRITWFRMSNMDQRLLLIRKNSAMEGFNRLLGGIHRTEYLSEFEIGSEWQQHTQINGSFLTICCSRNHITISSFLLGKLRGAVILRFDQKNDLPYFWKLYSNIHSWMSGIHEQVYFYGYDARAVRDILTPFWDRSGEYIVMDSLGQMQITAGEETYGFPLEHAFPAILLSLNFDQQPTEELHENHNGNS